MTPTAAPEKSKSKSTSLDVRVGRGSASRPTTGPMVSCRRSSDRVILTWTCGATRSFTPEDASFALENITALSQYGDVTLKDADSDSRTFYARVVDGRFYANDGRAPNLDGDYHVPWGLFRNAVLKAIGTKEAKARSLTPPEPVDEDDWRRQNE